MVVWSLDRQLQQHMLLLALCPMEELREWRQRYGLLCENVEVTERTRAAMFTSHKTCDESEVQASI